MGILLALVAAVLVFVIAAVAVGKTVGDARGNARQSVYDLDEAELYVSDRLPIEIQGQISHDDVRLILGWYLDYLAQKEIAYERDEVRSAGGNAVVVAEDTALGWVLGRAAEAEVEVADVEVLVVIEEGMRYLEAIGAVGAAVAEPPEFI